MLAAQAQKEITHNEALIILDALLPGCVEAVLSDPGALEPDAGCVWIVGADPVGAWADRGGHVAIFTEGGWRFAPPVAGMRLHDRAREIMLTFDGSEWVAPPVVDAPAGGATIDAEARTAVAALISAMRLAGMLNAT